MQKWIHCLSHQPLERTTLPYHAMPSMLVVPSTVHVLIWLQCVLIATNIALQVARQVYPSLTVREDALNYIEDLILQLLGMLSASQPHTVQVIVLSLLLLVNNYQAGWLNQ